MTHPSLLGLLEGVRAFLRRRAGAAIVLAAVATVGVVLILAWLLSGSEGWTPGTPIPLLLFLVAFLGPLALAVAGYRRLRRWTDEAGLTGEVERSARLPDGSVRAQAELLRSTPTGVSEALTRAGERSLLMRLTEPTAVLAGMPGQIVHGWFRSAGGVVGVVVLALLAILVLSPDRSRSAWAGLVHPVALLRPAPLPALTLQPGDARLPRGVEPRVAILAPGRDSVTLHWRAVGEVERALTETVPEGGAVTTFLPPLDGEVRYWATSIDGAATAEYLLVPEDPSILMDLTIEAVYPPHTRLAPETFRGSPPTLVVPQGTRLTVSGGVEGAGDEVTLVGENSGAVVLSIPVDGGRFTGSWSPTGSGTLLWVVRGGQEGARPPPPIDLEIVPDLPPTLEVPLPGSDGDLPLSLQLPVLMEATDDYGVSWIEVETRLRDRSGAVGEPVLDRIAAGDRPTVTLRTTLDFREWGLLPGEEVLLRARAADNAPSPQFVESALFSLRMPLESELRELARTRIDEAGARTEDLVDQAARELAELRTMERQAELEATRTPSSDDPDQRFQEREELRQALERQAELLDEAEELRRQLEEARDALPEEEERDRELADRMAELERLLEEVLGPEGRERLDELLEMLREGEVPEAAGEILREAVERQESMQRRLEQALEQLQRSALEESFRSAEEEVRSLIEEQREVAEQLAEGEGTETQEELARRAEEVEQQLQDLEERLREQGEQEAAERTSEAGEQLQEARQAMEEAAEESERGRAEEAAERAEEAARELEEALQGLEETRADLNDEFEDEMQDALRRGAQSALGLARRQGDLRRDLQNAGPIRRGELEGDHTAVMDGLRNLAGELAVGTRQNAALGEEITRAIGAAMQAVERTVDGIRRSPSFQAATDTSAGEAQRAMHAVALLALSGLGDGQSDAPGAAGASAEEILAELDEVSQAQESLNRDARALGDDAGPDGITSRLEELAQTQDAIASTLGELSRQPGAGELPGSLEALAEEAEELAEELTGGRLDATTLDRQEQFLERLLAAGRTLERDGPTEEREGTPPGVLERRIVSPLPGYLLDALALPLPDSGEMERLSPAQRRLVLDYFDRVNRRQAGGDGP